MFPLIIVAFAGIGVTRLALLALELHESNNPVREPEPYTSITSVCGYSWLKRCFRPQDEVVSPGEVTVTKEATIEEMRRLEKPAKVSALFS
jgi:hypothetical protein